MAYQNNEQPYEALQDYSKAIELDPPNPYALINRSLIYNSYNMYDLALIDMVAAIEADPSDADSWNNRGSQCRAPVAWRAARGRVLTSWLGAGFLFLNQGRLDEALSDLQKAVDIDPTHCNAQASLGRVYMNLGQPEKAHAALTLAVTAADAAIAKKPTESSAYYARARANRSLGRVDLSLSDLEASIRLHPKSAEVHCERTYALVEAGHFAEAAESIRRVVALNDGGMSQPQARDHYHDDDDGDALAHSHAPRSRHLYSTTQDRQGAPTNAGTALDCRNASRV